MGGRSELSSFKTGRFLSTIPGLRWQHLTDQITRPSQSNQTRSALSPATELSANPPEDQSKAFCIRQNRKKATFCSPDLITRPEQSQHHVGLPHFMFFHCCPVWESQLGLLSRNPVPQRAPPFTPFQRGVWPVCIAWGLNKLNKSY